MIALLSTGLLAIIVALAVIAALLVRVDHRLNVISVQLSERRGWKGGGVMEWMANEALADHLSGRTEPLDIDSL